MFHFFGNINQTKKKGVLQDFDSHIGTHPPRLWEWGIIVDRFNQPKPIMITGWNQGIRLTTQDMYPFGL